MAPDGLNVIGDAYQGVAGRLDEADLNLGCGVPTRHAALKEMLGWMPRHEAVERPLHPFHEHQVDKDRRYHE